MIAMQIYQIGEFMKKLLTEEAFDGFYCCEGRVETFASFEISGHLNHEFFNSDSEEHSSGREYALWSEIKAYVYQLMRGKNLPLSFAFTLQLSRENTDWLLDRYSLSEYKELLKGLYLNIRYASGKLSIISGLAYNTFVSDRRVEQLWDDTAARYLRQNGIVFSP